MRSLTGPAQPGSTGMVLLVLLALVAGFPFAGAQSAGTTGTLSGRIVDARTHAGLDAAEIILDGRGSPRSARSGADGSWTLERVAAGRHELVVRRLGYLSANRTVDVGTGRDSGVVVELALSSRALDAIVVTAARREQRLKDVTTTTELVSRREIERTGSSDIASVLSEQTGIQFTGGHPSGSGVALEGLSDQRVLVLVDGVPLYGRIAGGLDLSRIPASAVERVEVVKGPQSTLYGNEAMGGVVNIITRGAVPEQSNAELSAVVGSDRRSDTDLFATTRRGNFSATANLGHRFVERTPGIAGTLGAFTDRLDGLATARWTPGPSLALDGSVLVLDDRQRWRSGTENEFADNTQTNLHAGATVSAGARRLTSTLSFSQLDHLSRASQFSEPIAGTGDRQVQRLAQADLLFSQQTSALVFDAGAQLRREYISSTDGRIAGGSRTLDSAEPYAQAEWSNDRWSIVPGARLSWNEQWGTFLSPRVAARVQVTPELTLRASVGRGFRAPDFKEMYLDFTNDAAFYAVHGNTGLRPEHSSNASLGAEWSRDALYGRAQIYVNQLHDFIETIPLPESGGFAQFTYGNIDRATTRGVELESGFTLGALHAEAGYAYLHARDLSSGGPLLGQPPHSGRLLLGFPLPLEIQASATGVHTGSTPMERDDDGNISSNRDAYTRLDLRFARRLLDRALLSVGADNVFDARPARWADATSRQIYLGVSWQLRPSGE